MRKNQFYEDLAKHLKVTRPLENWDENKKTQWQVDIQIIGQCLLSRNMKFRWDIWYAACGGKFYE